MKTTARIRWDQIHTVFLDMDGTLLDLHFDNHFFLEHVPRCYAQKHGVSIDQANAEILVRYKQVEGTMDWYCLDYWSRELNLDMAQLKREMAHMIAVHPYVPEFMVALRNAGHRLVLLTNAHQHSLALKMETTKLGPYMDRIITSHDLGLPKENTAFWDLLQKVEPFDVSSTLLIDDSLPVLRSAKHYGIAHLAAMFNPDSKLPSKDVEEFSAIAGFEDVISQIVR